MKRWCYLLVALLTLSLMAGLAVISTTTHQVQAGTTSILTQHNDNSRTGANLNESILNTSNVNVNNFGKLFSRSVDGQIYTQPLYVPNLSIAGVTHNVVFVGTMHNSVYAFDADDPAQSAPLWQTNLGPSAPVPNNDFGNRYGPYHDVQVELGIVSTPVIDLTSNTIYVVAFTKEGSNSYGHRLHALDITTGQHKSTINGGQPAFIQASVSGTGDASVGGTISFQNIQQLQRPALTLANGVVYLVFASHADTDPYHGWILGYNATTLQQVAVFNTTPNGSEGGIWMSGQGPVVDSNNNLYVFVGNGTTDNPSNPASMKDFGEGVLKLSTVSGLSLADWFIPYNYDSLNSSDTDLGSAGPLMLPGTNFLVGGGKQGTIYLLNTNNPGHFHSGSDSQIVQSFTATNGHIHGSPVYWNSPGGGRLYVWGEYSKLNAYAFNGSTFNPTAISSSSNTAPNGMPGAMLSISANGTTAGSGILWASLPWNGDANTGTVEGVLRAFDATDLSKEIWNSKMNDTRDHYGNFAKFVPPTIVNGKVYMATFSNILNVYGPLNNNTPVPTSTPGTLTSYEAESGANTLVAPAKVSACGTCSGGSQVGYLGNGGTLKFNSVNVSTAGNYTLTLNYIDGTASPGGRTMFMSVNGGAATSFTTPGNGSWTIVQSLNVSVNLNAGNNTILFSNPNAYAADIDRILINGGASGSTPTATNTPVATTANTPVATTTNTPVATTTNTPVTTPTNTPVATTTNTPTVGAKLIIEDFSTNPPWPGNNALGAWSGANSFVNGGGGAGVVSGGALALQYNNGGWFGSDVNRNVATYTYLVIRIKGATGGEESQFHVNLNGVDKTLGDLSGDTITTSDKDIRINLNANGVNKSSFGQLQMSFWFGHSSTIYIGQISFQ